MDQRAFKWLGVFSIGFVPLFTAPAIADDDDWDDDDEVEVRVYRERPSRTYTYRYHGPEYRTYGYVEGDDYTTPEHAWWHDYERMNANRRSQAGGQIYGYAEPEQFEVQAVPERVRLRGTIVELRQMRSSEFDRPQVLAFIETNRGVHRVVLGPVDEIRGVDIQPGDTLTVSGTTRTISGRTNIVADRFESQYVRYGSRMAPTEGYVARPQNRWHYGEVRDDDNEDINGVRHKLARVKLDTGETVKVDLGPSDAIPDIDLDSGDRIAVFGRWGQIEDDTGIIAQEFQWQGRAFVLRGGYDVDVHAYR